MAQYFRVSRDLRATIRVTTEPRGSCRLLLLRTLRKTLMTRHLLPCVINFKSSSIRAQILADGTFPHELTTPNPYRNTLFNLDMFAGVCVLLSTRFESVWDYELQDGPGMRTVVARLYPYILDRGKWPYRADSAHFNALPFARPACSSRLGPTTGLSTPSFGRR